MKTNPAKTNGARFLESLNIPFELREYEVDPNDLTALSVAKKIGMPPEQVFKTLLVTGGPNIYRFAVIPGDAELDFKKLARASGLRKLEMAPLKEVQPLTGYIRGGVTLFGTRKPYPVYIDETVVLFDRISVSAGARGTQLILSPADYSAPPRLSKSKSRPPTSSKTSQKPRVPHPCTGPLVQGWETTNPTIRIPRRTAPDAPRPLDPSRQRPAHRVAFPRRHHLHAFLLRAGSRTVFHRL